MMDGIRFNNVNARGGTGEFAGLALPTRFDDNKPVEDVRDEKGNKVTDKWHHVGKSWDLIVELHSGDFGEGMGRQPALYVYQKLRPNDGVFVPLPIMWRFAEADALHTLIPMMANQVFALATKDDYFHLLDAMLNYFDELRKAPPEPKFRHASLDAFLESCDREGLSMFAEVNGEPIFGSRA